MLTQEFLKAREYYTLEHTHYQHDKTDALHDVHDIQQSNDLLPTLILVRKFPRRHKVILPTYRRELSKATAGASKFVLRIDKIDRWQYGVPDSKLVDLKASNHSAFATKHPEVEIFYVRSSHGKQFDVVPSHACHVYVSFHKVQPFR
mmetsp:Transcript_50042/g.57598  ORF Transcript_50042/g.57598 Transcript_50042/m.57598 type:complete len:147 (-) Transcript_50042:478-918(-)